VSDTVEISRKLKTYDRGNEPDILRHGTCLKKNTDLYHVCT
jgi:hypothetical protein